MTPKKRSKPLLWLVGFLVILVAILVYVNRGAKTVQTRPVAAPSRAATPSVSAPATPSAAPSPAAPQQPSGVPPAGTPPRTASRAGTPSPDETLQPRGTPQRPGAPSAATGSAATNKPSPKGTPPAGPSPTSKDQPPATTVATQPKLTPEEALVGVGDRGRADPFAPLVVPSTQRAGPLPPPPSVGLPLPPGFTAPGGPGTPPPAGTGMRVAGIMGSRSRVAIIEVEGKTYIVRVGDRVGDAVVLSISSDKVVLKRGNEKFELGFGGERSL
jgi:hypothetical protein